MVWIFSTELGFAAGGLVAFYLGASNTAMCMLAVAGALIATDIRHLLTAGRPFGLLPSAEDHFTIRLRAEVK